MPKYYSGTVTFNYVSDRPLGAMTAMDILDECDSGCAVCAPEVIKETEITEEAAKALAVEYGSTESFFGDDDEDADADK
jgi:hypothetical protein